MVPVSTTDVVVTGTTGSSAKAGDIVNDVNAMAVASARDFEYLIVISRTSDSRICTREKIPFAKINVGALFLSQTILWTFGGQTIVMVIHERKSAWCHHLLMITN
jgi:hypothetical protein